MLSNTFKRPTKPVGAFRDKTSVRRSRFLEEQTKLRKSFFEELREKALDALLSHATDETPEISETAQKVRNEKNKNRQFAPNASQYVSRQLVIPDFLVDVPADLGHEWLAFMRPEGQRVVLIASGGRCCVFNKSGFFVESFQTALPSNGCTILDGVLVTPPQVDCSSHHPLELEEDAKILDTDNRRDSNGGRTECSIEDSFELSNGSDVMNSSAMIVGHVKTKKVKRKKKSRLHWIAICDCICWNDCSMGESSAECRYFMLKSRCVKFM